jgi:hypothetical protein
VAIATLDDVKAAAGIAPDDTSKDEALQLALDAASAKVLDLTRHVEATVGGRIDTFRDVQLDTVLALTKRPVAALTTVEARSFGNSGWTTMSADLVDANEGEIVVLGMQNWWPPTLRLTPASQRWRNPRWPIVRVTYDVTGVAGSVPGDLLGATSALAVYWWQRDNAGAASVEKVGQLARTWTNEPLPGAVLSRLASYRRSATWV